MADNTGENSAKNAAGAAAPLEPARPDYEEWFGTAEGALALAAQQALLRRLAAVWPRRGHKLLEIGCGAGIFLENLWEAGFDVSGQEQDGELARRAAARLGRRAEITLGSPERLPFDDQSFDYVVCLGSLEFAADPWAVLREALRLASRGLLLSFPNALSLSGLAALCRRNQKRARNSPGGRVAALGRGKLLSPWKIWRFIRKEGPPLRQTWGSVLLGPPRTWKNNVFGRKLNLAVLSLPLGCCVMLRLDLHPDFARTPLLLKTKKQRGAGAALANKSLPTAPACPGRAEMTCPGAAGKGARRPHWNF